VYVYVFMVVGLGEGTHLECAVGVVYICGIYMWYIYIYTREGTHLECAVGVVGLEAAEKGERFVPAVTRGLGGEKG
jgi:hypothetical protein